jgi:hypothetical protein
MCTLFSLKMCHTFISLKLCSTYLCPASSRRIVTWYLIINMYVISHTSKNLHNNLFYLHLPISSFTNYWHKYVVFHSSINQYASLHIHKHTYDTPCQQLKHGRWTHMASTPWPSELDGNINLNLDNLLAYQLPKYITRFCLLISLPSPKITCTHTPKKRGR